MFLIMFFEPLHDLGYKVYWQFLILEHCNSNFFFKGLLNVCFNIWIPIVRQTVNIIVEFLAQITDELN